MNCYNHTDTAALGICKHCHKGICKSCLVDLGDGLACQATCVEDVEKLNRLVRKGEKSHKTAASQYFTSGIIFIILGGFVVFIPMIINNRFDPAAIVFGSLFVALGIWRLITGLRYNDDEKPL